MEKRNGMSMKEYNRMQTKRYRERNPEKYHMISARYHLRKLDLEKVEDICRQIRAEKKIENRGG